MEKILSNILSIGKCDLIPAVIRISKAIHTTDSLAKPDNISCEVRMPVIRNISERDKKPLSGLMVLRYTSMKVSAVSAITMYGWYVMGMLII